MSSIACDENAGKQASDHAFELETIAREIRALMRDTRKEQKKIGVALFAVKSSLPRRAFTRWLEQELHLPPITAQRFINVAQGKSARAIPNQPMISVARNYAQFDQELDARDCEEERARRILIRYVRNVARERHAS